MNLVVFRYDPNNQLHNLESFYKMWMKSSPAPKAPDHDFAVAPRTVVSWDYEEAEK